MAASSRQEPVRSAAESSDRAARPLSVVSAPHRGHLLRVDPLPIALGQPPPRHGQKGDFPPPPDGPKIVTFAESPPNCAMLSRTHCSDALMPSMPTLPESANSAGAKEPERVDRETMVDADDTTRPATGSRRRPGTSDHRYPPPWITSSRACGSLTPVENTSGPGSPRPAP